MELEIFPQYFVSLLTFILALLILIYNKKNTVNITFSLACLQISVYIFAISMKYHPINMEQMMFWERILNFSLIPMPLFFYHCFSYLRKRNRTRNILLAIGYLYALFLAFLNAAGLLVPQMDPSYFFNQFNSPLKHYPYYSLMFFLFICQFGAIYNAYLLYKNEKMEAKKKRYGLLFFALTIGIFGLIDYIPQIFHVQNWYPIGTFFPVIGLVIATYIFLKYNIDQYNRIIRRNSLLSFLYIFLFGIYLFAFFLILNFFHYQINLFLVLMLIFPILIHYLIFEKIRGFFLKMISRLFFKNESSYSKIIAEYSNEMLSILDKKIIICKTLKMLKEQYHLRNCFLLLNVFSNERTHLYLIKENKVEKVELESKKTTKWAQMVMQNKDPFIPKDMISFSEINLSNESQGISLSIPLYFKEELFGVLSLGERIMDETYSDFDIQLLKMIGGHLCIALKNSESVQNEIDKVQEEKIKLKEKLNEVLSNLNFQAIITQNEKMLKILKTVQDVSHTDASVLITGESGTGKELIAKAIHENSNRSNGRFIAINCGAIPSELIESELFGYEKGAFTGAYKTHKGKFEEANGGTLFLDEIGELKIDLQVKLLRALQEKKIERIGSSKTIELDLRIISATNKNLEEQITNNLFRKDLYYRINLVSIEIPPLRERKEDIPLLFFHFLKKYSEKNQSTIKNISTETLKALKNYAWPGNVRELESLVHSLILTKKDSDTVETKDLPEKFLKYDFFGLEQLFKGIGEISFPIDLKEIMEQYERKIIEKAFSQNSKNQNKTAKNLGINLSGLQYKLKKYNLH